MKLGPKIVYSCPNCGNRISRQTLISGNTFIAEYWSDGKRIAKMLPEFPSITKCSKCNQIFWISDAKEVGKITWENRAEWIDVEEATFLSVYDYIDVLINKNYKNKDDEFFLLLNVLRGFNDRVRRGNKLVNSETDKELWENNIHRIINILKDRESIENKLLLGELFRNLGDFDNAIKILKSINNPDYSRYINKIIIHAENKNPYVCLIYSTLEDLLKDN